MDRMTQKGEEKKKSRAEPWEIPIFQELAKEETRLREMELDQLKRCKSSEDNGSIDAKGLQVGPLPCHMPFPGGNMHSGLHCGLPHCAPPTAPGPLVI